MKRLLALLLVLSFAFVATAQQGSATVKENKYRINLPSYWGNGNKVWGILTDKLPLICEELKDKELCGDGCKPKYSVDFFLTESVVEDYSSKENITTPNTNTRQVLYNTNDPQKPNYVNPNNTSSWNITSYFSFQCYLLLRDENGKILTRMILVDTNEVWEVSHNVKLSPGASSHQQNMSSYIDNNRDNLKPVIKDLLAIADKKMLSL
ncbi:MAG: hypothetical protein ABIR30_01240 [Chitinophagaceae bacterium]